MTGRPAWWQVVRALREASGITQDGWAMLLSVSRRTVQRWESGETLPDPAAEAALIAVCGERRLFRTFADGPLRGMPITAELVCNLLAEARVGARIGPVQPRPAPAQLIGRGGDLDGRVYRLEAAVTTIGRGTENDIVIPHANVSRLHARVCREAGGYVLLDLGSKNGTLLNGRPVLVPTPLGDGDLIVPAGLPVLALAFNGSGRTVTVEGAQAGVWIDLTAAEVWLGGRRLDLAPDEYAALALLYERANIPVEAGALAARVWPGRKTTTPAAEVERLISSIRAKLGDEPGYPRLLPGSPGDGYRLVIG